MPLSQKYKPHGRHKLSILTLFDMSYPCSVTSNVPFSCEPAASFYFSPTPMFLRHNEFLSSHRALLCFDIQYEQLDTKKKKLNNVNNSRLKLNKPANNSKVIFSFCDVKRQPQCPCPPALASLSCEKTRFCNSFPCFAFVGA